VKTGRRDGILAVRRKKKRYRNSNSPVQGEYACVCKKSSVFYLIDRAHKMPLTREQAEKLVIDLSIRFLDGQRPTVRFRKESRGRANASRWSICLPLVSLKEGELPFGKLRVGVVVHEVAHLATYRSGSLIRHGERFVQVFDGMLEWMERTGWLSEKHAGCAEVPTLPGKEKTSLCEIVPWSP